MGRRGGGIAALVLAAGVAAAGAARAGPPYVTDDAEPTDLGHWEIYNFVGASHTPGATSGQAGLDFNYGAAKDLQLTLVVPVAFQTGVATGMGDVELAAKYKFIHQSKALFSADVAVFPRLFAPTAGKGLGPGHASLLLPLWAEKDMGPWSVFGGGGYTINPGPDERNFWISGLTVTRTVNARLQLGAEVYHQTPDTRDGRAFTGLNLGAIYKLTPHWSLLGAAGPGVQNARDGGQYDVYFALEATY